MTSQKVRENRARRVAVRRGYEISKKRTTDPLRVDAGWMLVKDDKIVLKQATMDDLEKFLDIDTSKDTPEPSPESGS